jgi:hypothetical protein
MSFFGAVFFVAAIVPETGWRTPLLLVPCIAFAVFSIAAIRRLRSATPQTADENPRSDRIISWATVGEGVAIPVMIVAVDNTGHPGLVLPGIALIVGLHFLPMAYAIPFPRFYALGGSLIVAAALGAVLPAPVGWIVSGLSASAALWMASVVALRRQQRS